MYIAAFVAAFNENIINVALHDIMAAFLVSATTAQWLVSGYMIVTSIFTAIMAFLSGRFSTRKLLFFRMRMYGRRRSPVPVRSVV